MKDAERIWHELGDALTAKGYRVTIHNAGYLGGDNRILARRMSSYADTSSYMYIDGTDGNGATERIVLRLSDHRGSADHYLYYDGDIYEGGELLDSDYDNEEAAAAALQDCSRLQRFDEDADRAARLKHEVDEILAAKWDAKAMEEYIGDWDVWEQVPSLNDDQIDAMAKQIALDIWWHFYESANRNDDTIDVEDDLAYVLEATLLLHPDDDIQELIDENASDNDGK